MALVASMRHMSEWMYVCAVCRKFAARFRTEFPRMLPDYRRIPLVPHVRRICTGFSPDLQQISPDVYRRFPKCCRILQDFFLWGVLGEVVMVLLLVTNLSTTLRGLQLQSLKITVIGSQWHASGPFQDTTKQHVLGAGDSNNMCTFTTW